jgi:aspartyl/asparaginyl beta-hydroxylase (cupin superfamily)
MPYLPVWSDPFTAKVRDAWRSQAAQLVLKSGPGGSCMVPLVVSEPGVKVVAVALWPSRQIVAHTDPPIPGKRYHLPIQTNEGCWVFHGGEWAQLQLGHWYEMDPTEIHGAVNWGDTVRVHLMVDAEGK